MIGSSCLRLRRNAPRDSAGGVLRSERGVAFLEMTMVIGLFLTMVLVLVESVIIGYSALTIQYVASKAARYAMASTVGVGPGRLGDIQNFTLSQARIFGLSLNPTTQLSICAIAKDPGCHAQDAGGPGDFVLIRIKIPAGFFLGRFNFFLYGEALTKNEHFS